MRIANDLAFPREWQRARRPVIYFMLNSFLILEPLRAPQGILLLQAPSLIRSLLVKLYIFYGDQANNNLLLTLGPDALHIPAVCSRLICLAPYVSCSYIQVVRLVLPSKPKRKMDLPLPPTAFRSGSTVETIGTSSRRYASTTHLAFAREHNCFFWSLQKPYLHFLNGITGGAG